MTQALFDSGSEDDAIERVLAALGKELDWVVGGFWVLDEKEETLRFTHAWHSDTSEAGRYIEQNASYRFRRGEGLPGRVWETEAAVWIGDVATTEEFPRREVAKAYGLHGGVAFPVFVGHDLVGVIDFFSRARIAPEESFVRVLTGIGSELGQFLRRQRAEQRLRDSEARFRTLTETASDAIVTIDAQSIIRYANPATEKLFGYTSDELVGMKLPQLMPERMRASHGAGLARFSRTGKKNIPWTGVQLPALHRSGREFPVEISLGEFVLEGSRRFTGIMRDVTERVRQQQALEEASAELEVSIEELQERTREAEAASKAKNEFLAAMSHELRTPLQAVIGYAGLLSDGIQGTLNEDQARAVDRIGASAQHLLGLIDQVLDLARSEAGRLKLKRERVDLCELAAEAAELVRPQAEEKGLELKVEYCEDEKDRIVIADPGRVRQIVLNLVSNSVKFTAEGRVEVSFEKAHGRALVQVTDTGIGIPSELLPRVFEPFYQTEAGLRNRSAGMGLGLAISRDLAITMGGGLEVTSEQGKGSRFTLWLPDQP